MFWLFDHAQGRSEWRFGFVYLHIVVGLNLYKPLVIYDRKSLILTLCTIIGITLLVTLVYFEVGNKIIFIKISSIVKYLQII